MAKVRRFQPARLNLGQNSVPGASLVARKQWFHPAGGTNPCAIRGCRTTHQFTKHAFVEEW